jgi:hypothetical protein
MQNTAAAEPPAAEGTAADCPPQPGRLWSRVMSWSAWAILAGYIVVLVLRVQVKRRSVTHPAELTLGDLLRWRQLLAESLAAFVQTGLCFFLFGFLVAAAIGAAPAGRSAARGAVGWGTFLARWLLIGALGAGLWVSLCLAESGRLPGLALSFVPLAGYLPGLWVGRGLACGPRAAAWLVPKLALGLAVAAAGLAALGLLTTARQPLALDVPQVTSADKRRLVEILKRPKPLEGGSRSLYLAENDLNLILAMGMAQVVPGGKGLIALDEGTISAVVSLPLNESAGLRRWYLNGQAAWQLELEGERLKVRFLHCRIGRLAVPQFLLDQTLDAMTVMVLGDRDLKAVVAALGALRVHSDGVEAVLVSRGLVDRVLPSLVARLGRNPGMAVRTAVYYRHLIVAARQFPQEGRFSAFLRAAFTLARTRSRENDPMLENRAAILALAILLGHRQIEHLVGPVSDDALRSEARRLMGRVTLRGRPDWCRHYFVSAALALLSNESLSDEAGLLKEELDAGRGGSGFSFSDLIADRAGTQFALAATRDEAAARRMQSRLADGFQLGLVFPEAADLPEGISDEQLEKDYGGVGGAEYNQVIGEIERRLAGCEGLQ